MIICITKKSKIMVYFFEVFHRWNNGSFLFFHSFFLQRKCRYLSFRSPTHSFIHSVCVCVYWCVKQLVMILLANESNKVPNFVVLFFYSFVESSKNTIKKIEIRACDVVHKSVIMFITENKKRRKKNLIPFSHWNLLFSMNPTSQPTIH